MSVPFTTVAYGIVIASGLTLLCIGHPIAPPPLSPTTPGLRVAAAGPTVIARVSLAATSVTEAGVTLTSTAIDLPASARDFPTGPGMEVAQQNCTACHSVGMVMTQPPLSKGTWEAEVNKMRAVYKAPIAEEDIPAIVGYLANLKSPR